MKKRKTVVAKKTKHEKSLKSLRGVGRAPGAPGQRVPVPRGLREAQGLQRGREYGGRRKGQLSFYKLLSSF